MYPNFKATFPSKFYCVIYLVISCLILLVVGILLIKFGCNTDAAGGCTNYNQVSAIPYEHKLVENDCSVCDAYYTTTDNYGNNPVTTCVHTHTSPCFNSFTHFYLGGTDINTCQIMTCRMYLYADAIKSQDKYEVGTTYQLIKNKVRNGDCFETNE